MFFYCMKYGVANEYLFVVYVIGNIHCMFLKFHPFKEKGLNSLVIIVGKECHDVEKSGFTPNTRIL